MPLPVFDREKARQYGVDPDASSPPYPASRFVAKLIWDEEPVRIGNGINVGDNWPITWGDDDVQYASYGDGHGFSGREPGLTIGFARIIGDPPHHRGEDLNTNLDIPAGSGPDGIKSSGMLMVDGVLYLFVRNYKVEEDWHHSRLAWSIDKGRNWTWANWYFSNTFGCPDFIQFGKNYGSARDEYVYIVSQDNDDAYTYCSNLVLARVPKDQVPAREQYEFFAGIGKSGQPAWSKDLNERKPIFTDSRGVQRVGMTYNPALRRFFLATSHWTGEGTHTSALGVFEAPEPWGPWATVYYDDHWSGDNVTFHHKFPAKWISADGRTMWLAFSGLGGGNYTFCIRRATLETNTYLEG